MHTIDLHPIPPNIQMRSGKPSVSDDYRYILHNQNHISKFLNNSSNPQWTMKEATEIKSHTVHGTI